MTERQFSELRNYADGLPLDIGGKPLASLVSNGWLKREFDNFYVITPKGTAALDAMRKGGTVA